MSSYKLNRNSGGIPGFGYLSQLSELVATRMTAQAKAVNDAWDKIVGPTTYDFRDWTRDLAKILQNGLAMTEDVLTFPLRYRGDQRPPWVSLAWSASDPADAVKGEIVLPEHIDTATAKPSATNLERIGPETGSPVLAQKIVPSLESGDRLAVAIKDLRVNNAATVQPGHFIGFVTMPNHPQPIAIIFLTVTS
jgi:hypothetical protein